MQMKTLVLVGFIAGAMAAQAQDLIIFKNGTLQNAKVLEVGTTNVVYKKADNPDGPNYVSDKGEISVIEYANGARDVMPYASNNVAVPAPQPNYSQPGYSQPMVTYAQPRPRVNVVVAAPIVSPFYYGGMGCVGAYRPFVSRPVHRNVYVRPSYNRHCRW